MPNKFNDIAWIEALPRAKVSAKYRFTAIHVAIQMRFANGVAPVLLQTDDGYFRPPVHLEAAFELCLRHLHGHTSLIQSDALTVNSLLANRALTALKLPGRYVPTAGGNVLDMASTGDNMP